MPGVWRLRLPLPWPGVPHCNAWAVRADDGVVLFDTGMATDDGSMYAPLHSRTITPALFRRSMSAGVRYR